MKRSDLLTMIGAALVVFAGLAQADVPVPTGINPTTGSEWQAGDSYRLAFITSDVTYAASSDISTYNAFVQGVADASTVYDISAADGVIWKIIGSTNVVDARDNTSTNPKIDGTGEPIYLLDGTTIVANNYADLWDGEINHIINMDENGGQDYRNLWVLSGTALDGTAAGQFGPLGNGGDVQQGDGRSTTQWIWREWAGTTKTACVYALSEPLVVPGGTNIPSVPGLSQATTEDELESASFAIGEVRYENSDTVPADVVILARQYVNQSDETGLNKVIAKLFNKYSSQPNITRIIDYIAQCFLKKNPEKAQELYTEAIKKLSNHPDIAWLYGASIRCQVTQQDLTDARHSIKAFQENYSDYTDLSSVVFSLADTCRNWKKYLFARDLYEYALENSSDVNLKIKSLSGVGLCEIRLKNEDGIKRVIDSLKKNYSSHEDLFTRLYSLSYEYWYVHDYTNSKSLCKYLIDNYPENDSAIKAQMGIARCEIRLNNHVAAEKAIQKLMTDYAGHERLCKVLNYLAYEFLRKKKSTNSKKLWRIVAKNSSDTELAINAQAQIVHCEINSGNEDSADQAIRFLKNKFSNYLEMHDKLLAIGQHFGRLKKYDKAKILYQYVASNCSDNSSSLKGKAWAACVDIKVGNETAAEQSINKLKDKYSKSPKFFDFILDLAKEYEKAMMFDKACDLYLHVSQNSSDIDMAFDNRVNAITCAIEMGDERNVNQTIESLKKDFVGHKDYFGKLSQFAKRLWLMGQIENSKNINQYIYEKSSDAEMKFNARINSIDCCFRLNEIDLAKNELKLLIRDHAQSPELNKKVFEFANRLESLKKRFTLAEEFYQYIIKNSSDKELALKAHQRILNIKIKAVDQQGFAQEIKKYVKNFSNHPVFDETMEKIGINYFNMLYNTRRDLKDDEETKKFYSFVLNQYPHLNFAIAAQCDLMKLNSTHNIFRNKNIDDIFKDFVADDSNKSKYFSCLDFILSYKGRFRDDYKQYTLEQIKNKLAKYSFIQDKVNMHILLIRYSPFSNYSKEINDLIIELANNENCSLFINLIDELRKTKDKRYAADLCKLYLNHNPKGINKQIVLIRLYNIKIEDGKGDHELSEQLGNFISQNIEANKDLACEAMLLQGRLFINLGEIKNAREIYETYKKEASDTENMPEVLYYIGYAYLIQGDYKKAEESLGEIVKDYSKSIYTNKAKQYIGRIKKMTE